MIADQSKCYFMYENQQLYCYLSLTNQEIKLMLKLFLNIKLIPLGIIIIVNFIQQLQLQPSVDVQSYDGQGNILF